MRLSLWIIKEALNEFSPVIKCTGGKNEIEELRLAGSSAGLESGILYIGTSDLFFRDGKRNVVCFHKNDYLILNTEDLFSVSNQLLSVFSRYARWEELCKKMISEECSLSELLTMGEHIFKNPLHIVDATQFLIASSTSAKSLSFPGVWEDYLEKRGFPSFGREQHCWHR